jgi:hypothetical protein
MGMESTADTVALRHRIRNQILFFMIALVLSGVTAFPLEWELTVAQKYIYLFPAEAGLTKWIQRIHQGLQETNIKYPFMAYGTDWLAFAHIIIAIAFLGPLRDPLKNIWVIEFGLIACAAVLPLAWIAGSIRGIPVYWRLIDCCFGLVGAGVLYKCYSMIRILEKAHVYEEKF